MKIRTLFTSSVLALTLGSVAFAQPPAGGAPAAPKTALEEAMGRINTANRGMTPGRGGAADLSDAAKKDEALKQVAIIKEAANAALKETPKWTPADKTSDADKAAYVAQYQATMKKFITAVEALEAGLKAGKSTEELTALHAALGTIQRDEGHANFRAPRGGRGGAPGGGGGPRGGQ